jgi:hypothetical protein
MKMLSNQEVAEMRYQVGRIAFDLLLGKRSRKLAKHPEYIKGVRELQTALTNELPRLSDGTAIHYVAKS